MLHLEAANLYGRLRVQTSRESRSHWARTRKCVNHLRCFQKKTGFYGLDVYSLWESLDEILTYLEKRDPDLIEAARKAFKCFNPHNLSMQM